MTEPALLPRILVTNDDGIHAPGLKVLERIARHLAREVWVCAPEVEQSGAGHSLTLRRPLRLRTLAKRRFAVDGTPTDCVLLAIKVAMRGKPPTLVLSGVNRGANLGEDVTYSGTIAAAMEATLLGVPAVALSLEATSGQDPDWHCPEHLAPALLRRLLAVGWPDSVLLNVNFPNRRPAEVTGVAVTRQGRRKLGEQIEGRIDTRGEHYYWIGPVRAEEGDPAGTDLEAIREGKVSITPLHLDLTHPATAARLASALS
ncbi:MAG: 5'/3'-nucleotidase SurE [Alphaproteobacteria bacterium]|nr:MAG: 5'/3'-nucleotidase SurE [Alphaproteobacteria bacterium]